MNRKTILVTGGAGYVGCALVSDLLNAGYRVRIVDMFFFGNEARFYHPSNNLELVKVDIRDTAKFAEQCQGVDTVVHLACISNDPSFELDPSLGKSINYDCFPGLVEACMKAGVRRFIYASSSSVYGVKDMPDVREDATLEPLTDYSKYKALCEQILLDHPSDYQGMERVVVRPATVCGWSPRLRLDLVVNALTASAIVNKRIDVHGGDQKRPNIHIQDMVDTYLALIEADGKLIDGEIFNAGSANHTVMELAKIVADAVGPRIGSEVAINVVPTVDNRSYHINSDKIRDKLGVANSRTVLEAILDVGLFLQMLGPEKVVADPNCYNIKTMQQWLAKGTR